MRTFVVPVALLAAVFAGIASPQSFPLFPSGLAKYLSLTNTQQRAIGDLNTEFSKYGAMQYETWSILSYQADQELFKDEPDIAVVGDAYAKKEAIRREYVARTTEVQSKIAATLTPEQVMMVPALLRAERLQYLVQPANCLLYPIGSTNVSPYLGGPYTCDSPGAALINYLKLTPSQMIAWNAAVNGYSDYQVRFSLQFQELDFQIDDLTLGANVDAGRLGAAYVARQKLSRDARAELLRMIGSLQGLMTDEQRTLLQALRDAQALLPVAQAAACFNILVLPIDLQPYDYGYDPKALPYRPYCYYESTSTGSSR